MFLRADEFANYAKKREMEFDKKARELNAREAVLHGIFIYILQILYQNYDNCICNTLQFQLQFS